MPWRTVIAGLFWLGASLPCAAQTATPGDPLPAALESITAAELAGYVEVLASDTYEGREAGSRGGRAAAGYLLDQLKHLQLTPAGTAGTFTQTFGNGYRNLLACIPGSDPELAGQAVLIGAHYDHVGYGTARNSFGPTGYIHNGADDNASGVAGLLEIAQAIQATAPRRTVIIALWDGEEKGLLGSLHWLKTPTFPRQQITVALNMDMIGRLQGDRLDLTGGRTAYGWRQRVSRQNTDGLLLDFAWEMRSDSDHHPFYQAGIPVLNFHTGLHEDYHRPSDDAHKLNLAGLQQVSRLVARLAWNLAQDESRLAFRAACRQESPQQARRLERGLPPLPGRLGIRLAAKLHAAGGVTVRTVEPGGAADTAGIRPGDRIVACEGAAIGALDSFLAQIVRAPKQALLSVVPQGGTTAEDRIVRFAAGPVRLGISWRADEAEPGAVAVVRVVPGSPAAVAGLKLGDRIYAVGGSPFSDEVQLRQQLDAIQGTSELLIERQGRLMKVSLELPVSSRQSAVGSPQ